MKLSEDQGLTIIMKKEVAEIVDDAILRLSDVLNKSFIAIHQEIRDATNEIKELKDEFNRKFDGLNNRLDDAVEKKADRSDVRPLEGRVAFLEG